MSSEMRKKPSDTDEPVQQISPKSEIRQSKRPTTSRYHGTGMRPSIITTINNTDPNKSTDNETSIISINNNNFQPTTHRSRRNNEPYESYIEDSFVGHWEHEDDEDDYHEDFEAESQSLGDENREDLHHPSTIEFDFDSFGPESFIYTPPANIDDQNPTHSEKALEPAEDPASSVRDSVETNIDISSNTNSRPLTLTEINGDGLESHAVKESKDVSEENKPLSTNEQSTDDTEQSVNNPTSMHDKNETLIDHQTSPSSRYRDLRPQLGIIDTAQIDMKVIEPYKKVISHAGYCHTFDTEVSIQNDPPPAVIVFSACYLPDRSRRDYDYVMDHLFLYVLSSLHELIADDYILIYLHNTRTGNNSATQNSTTGYSLLSKIKQSTIPTPSSTSSSSPSSPNTKASVENLGSDHQNNLPTFSWMKRCYQMIDRRLRKNLKILYLVKPTFWLKTIVIMCKPFISTKFSRKLKFVEDMNGLRQCLPIDKLILPASADNI